MCVKKMDLDTPENRSSISEVLSMAAVIFPFVPGKEKKGPLPFVEINIQLYLDTTAIKVTKPSFLGQIHTALNLTLVRPPFGALWAVLVSST